MDLMNDKNIKKWPIRLKVRTFGFHPKNLGALPGWATNPFRKILTIYELRCRKHQKFYRF